MCKKITVNISNWKKIKYRISCFLGVIKNKIGIYDICIKFNKEFRIEYFHIYYDEQQHGLYLGFIAIGWCGRPYKDI